MDNWNESDKIIQLEKRLITNMKKYLFIIL